MIVSVLFVSQRYEWIEFGGPTRGNITREQRHGEQNYRRYYKREPISWGHFKQQAPHHASEGQRSNQPNGSSDDREGHTLHDYQLEHITLLRAQRHANTNLLRSLGHEIRHHAVNSNCRQAQRQNREGAEQQHHKTT